MNRNAWLGALTALCLVASPSLAGPILPSKKLERANGRLCGSIVDYTCHHGFDNRIWSNALCQKRDMYVYLPPCYDPAKSYPVLVWLHGFLQDERSFLEYIVQPFDDAMCCGKLPPMIIAAPDGTIRGRPSIYGGSSFFLNSDAGNFEDYLINDVWPFLLANFPIRPEREAHVIGGVSMGGFGAYNQAIKHQCMFKVAFGIYPPLNLRWVDCHGRYMRNFDPDCWGWRESVRPCQIIGKFYCVGLVPLKLMLNPLFHRSPDTVNRLSLENPTEMIIRGELKPDDLDLYVGYGHRDEFNLDAQVESFLHVAREYGVEVAVEYDPRGRHNTDTALRLIPGIIDWLAPLVAPFDPNAAQPPKH